MELKRGASVPRVSDQLLFEKLGRGLGEAEHQDGGLDVGEVFAGFDFLVDPKGEMLVSEQKTFLAQEGEDDVVMIPRLLFGSKYSSGHVVLFYDFRKCELPWVRGSHG
jgi:hypothetical protein